MKKACLTKVAVDMRDAFFDEVFDIAKEDENVVFLTADMGAHSLIKFKRELPGQFINVGVAEQNMVGVAAGLALGGKRAFIYTIIPFATLRCYEQIKVDLCCMSLPVVIVGVGPGFTYGSDGPTHHGINDIAVMRALPEITILNPSDPQVTKAAARIAYANPGPTYVRIDKGSLSNIGVSDEDDFSDGLREISRGKDLTIIATGIMVHQAIEAATELNKRAISAGVVDLYRIKPLNKETLLKIIDNSQNLVTLEENNIVGGVGSLVAEALSDNERRVSLKRIAIPDLHCFDCGDRISLQRAFNLDVEGIVKTIEGFLARRENGFRH